MAHTHDDVDWAEWLPMLRRADELHADAIAEVAARLVTGLPADATVIDVGCGAGGMSAALATALRDTGGRLVLVDAVPELLDAAGKSATAAGAGGTVTVETVRADAAAADLAQRVPSADLIWASGVVHHLPDQQAALAGIAKALRPKGKLAIAEGGLDTRCLPWELGVGKPGLETRLLAGRSEWLREMRENMSGVVAMPYGWSTALTKAGLTDVGSFSALIEHSAPPTELTRAYAIGRIKRLAEIADEWIGPEDRESVRLLLDPDAPEYLGRRDDLYVLGAMSVHHGRLP